MVEGAHFEGALRAMPYSHNGDLEHLVEQITDVIVARLNGVADLLESNMTLANQGFVRSIIRANGS